MFGTYLIDNNVFWEEKSMGTTNEMNEILNTEELGELKDLVEVLNVELLKNHRIDKELYTKYDVKRGLRDSR